MLVWPHDLFCDLTFGDYISHRCMNVTWMEIYFYGCSDRNTSSLLRRRRRFRGFLSFVCFCVCVPCFLGGGVSHCANNFFIVCFLRSRLELYRVLLICCGGSNHFRRGKQPLPCEYVKMKFFRRAWEFFRPHKLKTRIFTYASAIHICSVK